MEGGRKECPICKKYAILLQGQKMCWDCYIKNTAEYAPECLGEEVNK